MARRRNTTAPPSTSVLPDELAAGPCIEDWTTPGAWPAWAQPGDPFALAVVALAGWTKAVRAWPADVGWEPELRGQTPMHLARVRHPWSRTYLLGEGELERVDYYEGRRDADPGRPQPRTWQSDS